MIMLRKLRSVYLYIHLWIPVGTQGKCEWKQDELEDSDTSGEEEKENVDKQKQITRKRKVNI